MREIDNTASLRLFVSSSPCGFTLLEMLTTVAGLIIVLGLMVDLAGYVRKRSASELTRRLLGDLDRVVDRYLASYRTPIPVADPLPGDGELPDEDTLLALAIKDNAQFVRVLKREGEFTSDLFASLPLSIYDSAHLRDAWGTPIVYLPRAHRMIGMAPQNRGFFFSAGPDRQFRTRDDNLYSYEQHVGTRFDSQ